MESERLLEEMRAETPIPRWLTLTGISGLGKTFAAKLILRKVRKLIGPFLRWRIMEDMGATTRHVPSFNSHFCKWRDVADELRNGNFGIIRDLREIFFLVIDDIGDEHETDFTNSKLYELLDGRMGKWTVITSNRTIKQIAEKERRMASRMIRDGNVQIELKGEDYSIRKLKGQR